MVLENMMVGASRTEKEALTKAIKDVKKARKAKHERTKDDLSVL